MICEKCSVEMECGYLGYNGTKWVPGKVFKDFLTKAFTKNIFDLIAWRCPKCNQVKLETAQSN